MQTRSFYRLRLKFAAVVMLAFVMTACNSADASKVGTAMKDVGIAVGGLQQAVHTANTATPALISDKNALAIYQICDRINLAGKQADSLTRQYSQLPTTAKPQLAALINPILNAVNDSLATGLVPITDPATKANIQAALESIRSGLVIVQAIVGG